MKIQKSCCFWGIQRYSKSQRALNALLSSCDFILRTQKGDTKGLKLGVKILWQWEVDGDRMLSDKEGAGKSGER